MDVSRNSMCLELWVNVPVTIFFGKVDRSALKSRKTCMCSIYFKIKIIVHTSDLCPFVFAGSSTVCMSVSTGGNGDQKRYFDTCKSFSISAHGIKLFVNVTYLRSIPQI